MSTDLPPSQRVRVDAPEGFPPLPDIPDEADTELERPIDMSDVLGHTILSLPLLGAQARNEWRQVGELREAQADKSLRYGETQTSEGRTIILAGQGSYLGVEGYALIVHQGRTHGVPAPEKEMLQPALHGVKRIIWIGAHGHMTGTMTLSSAAWCRAENIHLCVLDGSGMPLVEVLPEQHQDADLKRRQWLISGGINLPGSPSAGAIVRALIRRKIEGQYQTLARHTELPGQATCLALFRDWLAWLTLEQPTPAQQNASYLMKLEGRLAAMYFHAWEGWALTWSKLDLKRIPPHWLTARSRVSPLAAQHNGRHAIDPVNACLNYCYAALASQCRQLSTWKGSTLQGGFFMPTKLVGRHWPTI